MRERGPERSAVETMVWGNLVGVLHTAVVRQYSAEPVGIAVCLASLDFHAERRAIQAAAHSVAWRKQWDDDHPMAWVGKGEIQRADRRDVAGIEYCWARSSAVEALAELLER